jgi:toxin-antitoxin system PIN domain toxin
LTDLLDGNVLVALAIADHVHHEAAERWFRSAEGNFATCPITQGTLVRILLRSGDTADHAQEVLAQLAAHSRHEFWPDNRPYTQVSFRSVVGHRQVTDAYLAQLARDRNGRLVTFDQGLATLHLDVAVLAPTD